MPAHNILAVDLGAESGRAILGTIEDGRLQIREITRFPNRMVQVSGGLHWDVINLCEEITKSLKACRGKELESIGLDTWGVDFALLDRDGEFLGLPYTYRDSRTEGIMEEFFTLIPREQVYQLTGIQFLQFNTLFQLFAMARENSPLLKKAQNLLFIPDIFNYLLTGEKKTEFSFATTSQLYNPRKKNWDEELFAALDISRGIMQQIVPPGTVIGGIGRDVCRKTGLQKLSVVAPATHDTGSAVAAVPATGRDWAFISSGTWSLMGIETCEPIITDKAHDFNFTNEGGVGGTFRFLRNIMGLWLVQQCRNALGSYTYEDLMRLAADAAPFKSIINPDDTEFFNPPDMTEAVRRFCRESGQPVPESPGEIIRCVLESLALQYRRVLNQLHEVQSQQINVINIVGGGVNNKLLCQFTADATGLPVTAGPVEAAAVGNILTQALALGYVSSIAEVRDIVRRSFEPLRYEPRQTALWDEAYQRFQNIVEG